MLASVTAASPLLARDITPSQAWLLLLSRLHTPFQVHTHGACIRPNICAFQYISHVVGLRSAAGPGHIHRFCSKRGVPIKLNTCVVALPAIAAFGIQILVHEPFTLSILVTHLRYSCVLPVCMQHQIAGQPAVSSTLFCALCSNSAGKTQSTHSCRMAQMPALVFDELA